MIYNHKKSMTMYSNRTWLEFYRKLGYLLYAIAAADRQVTAAETDRLKTVLQDTWLKLEDSTDEFGGDAAYQVSSVFDWLLEETPSAEKAFEKFEIFFKENPSFFAPAIKAHILETANNIAVAFRDKNKAELTMLFRLYQLFK